jgi:putative ABC transport system permease protein
LTLIIKLAWRNIWRNKRRLLLTVTAVAFATLAVIAMRGVQLGTYAVNIKNAVSLFSGYMQIQHSGYKENPSLRLNFIIDSSLSKRLGSIREIKGFAPRVYGDGLISYKENSLGVALIGIDPHKEKSVTSLMNRIKEGSFFTSDSSDEAVVGYKLLENLKASVGDTVVILTQGLDGSLGNMKFKIVGTVKAGVPEFDAYTAFTGLSKAQELLALQNRIQSVVINLEDLNDIDKVKDELTPELKKSSLSALSWDELMPDFKQSIEFDNVSGMLFLLILIIVVAFGILNTVLMSVMERYNEFGIELAIGIPRIKLVYLVLIETFFISVIGIIAGNIIGWVINYYIIQNPIEFGSELGKMYEEYGFLPILSSSLDPLIFLNNSITILSIAVLACVYPMIKVFRLEPLKGIRYT